MSTRVILARTPAEADRYRRDHIGPDATRTTILGTSPNVLAGFCPTEVHVAQQAWDNPEFGKLMDELLACEAKSPVSATWFWGGKPIARDEALQRLGFTAPRKAQAKLDEKWARYWLDCATNPRSDGYRNVGGTQTCLAIAQVYATLAR